MQQALEAALGACGGILPAKGGVPAELTEPAFILTPRISRAMELAVERHGHQARKGTSVPYLTHLMSVAAYVGESGGSEDEMIAALLHDAVEDGGGLPLLEEIRKGFGSAVAGIVEGCTDDASGGEKAPWQERKQAFLRSLASASLPVLRVVCADKLHNALSIARDLKTIGPSVFERFKADREGTLWYYRSMARLFGALVQDEPDLDPGFRTLIRELRETVASLEAQ